MPGKIYLFIFWLKYGKKIIGHDNLCLYIVHSQVIKDILFNSVRQTNRSRTEPSDPEPMIESWFYHFTFMRFTVAVIWAKCGDDPTWVVVLGEILKTIGPFNYIVLFYMSIVLLIHINNIFWSSLFFLMIENVRFEEGIFMAFTLLQGDVDNYYYYFMKELYFRM